MKAKITLVTTIDYNYYQILVNDIPVSQSRKEYIEKRLDAVKKTLQALSIDFDVEFINRRNKLDKSKAEEILKSVKEIGKAATGRKYGVTKQAIQNFCKLIKE